MGIMQKLDHPSFIQPDDMDIKVWRYINLEKFMHLIIHRKLYFSRVDLLGDPHEGSIGFLNFMLRKEYSQKKGNENFPLIFSRENIKMIKNTYVNCWYCDNYESEAMWQIYCKANNGLAIQSTYKKLLYLVDNDDLMYIGKLNYHDPYTESFDQANLFNAIMHKRNSFEFEKEVRIVYADFDYKNSSIVPGQPIYGPELISMSFPIELENIIENIYINPYGDNWFFDLVREILKKHNINIKLRKSQLCDTPFY